MLNNKTWHIHRSSYIVLAFAILVAIVIAYSEIFRRPLQSVDQQNLTNPFLNSVLLQAQSIALKNKQGEFNLEKKVFDETINNGWELTRPKELLVNPDVMNHLFHVLKTLKIKGKLADQDIRLSNLMEQAPLLSIEVKTNSAQKESVSFYLVNTIDQSAYVSFSNRTGYFQVEVASLKFDTFDMQSFVDKEIFNLKLEDIDRVEIYKGSHQRGALLGLLKKHVDGYVDNNSKSLSPIKVAEFLGKIMSQKGQFLNQTQFRDNSVDFDRLKSSTLQNPSYEIKFIETSGTEHLFYLGQAGNFLNKSLLPKGEQVPLFYQSSTQLAPQAILVNKTIQQLLNTKISSLYVEN